MPEGVEARRTALRWRLLALTSVGAFMAPLDGSIVAVALPRLGPALDLSYGALLWVQASYMLTMAVLLIPLGRWADQRGRLRFYLAGIVFFTAGSLVAALSRSGGMLILGRVIQAGGGALLSATSAALITAVFPPSERGRALGINVMAVYAGLSVGPPLGGFLVGRFGWPSIFLVNLPIGAAVMAWGVSLARRFEDSRGPRRPMDLLGSVLLGCSLLGLLMPLTFAPERGWGDERLWILLGLGLLAVLGLWAWERRASEPLLDPALIRNRVFAAGNLAAFLNYGALSAVGLLTAVHLQLVQGRSPQMAGWILLGQPVVQAALSPVAGHFGDRLGARVLSTFGMGLTALGLCALGLLSARPSVPALMAALALVGMGMAAFSAPNTSAIMGAAPKDRLGVASAFLATMRVTGQAFGVTLLGGLAAHELGSGGWKQMLRGASPALGEAFAHGYRVAMFTGAGLALLGAWASLARPKKELELQAPH